MNQTGIVLQVLAAAYIVFQAYRTTRTLEDMKITFDSIEHVIARLGSEMRGQFKHQVIGFALLALGAILQLLA
jgi:hypothetical protein